MPPKLTEEIRGILTRGEPADLITLNPDGSQQVSVVWIGLQGDEIICAHIGEWRKIRNIRRDPGAALSIDTGQSHLSGLDDYLAITGTARISQGDASQLLRRLAAAYIGPGTELPWTQEPPPGHVTYITAERIIRPDPPDSYKPTPARPSGANEQAISP
jgi:PPOX class probable F420-dependent enzyme